jgi:hypothetical protein
MLQLQTRVGHAANQGWIREWGPQISIEPQWQMINDVLPTRS